MRAVAFFTNKGGVGKTTLLCNLAAYLAKRKKFKILVVDADPQTNATQYMFDDDVIENIYTHKSAYTIYSVARPLSLGKGYSTDHKFQKSPHFGVDVLLGDPRFALIEDVLASDWSSGDIRGLRTTFMFRQFLESCETYDFVFFDMGPSLGSINRSVLLACNYFIIPISIDIFSIRASENISTWLTGWKKKLKLKLGSVGDLSELEVSDPDWRLRLLGYVSQQYTAKRDATGKRRPVKAYERIMKQIPESIEEGIILNHQLEPEDIEYELGTIPNLHSLVPLSQVGHTPIWSLKSGDGIVGAHFAKVSDAERIFESISNRFLENLEVLE